VEGGRSARAGLQAGLAQFLLCCCSSLNNQYIVSFQAQRSYKREASANFRRTSSTGTRVPRTTGGGMNRIWRR